MFFAVLLSAGLLVSCGDEVPTDFGDQVRSNFLEQCLGNTGESNDTEAGEQQELRDECECMYTSLRDNLSFTEFQDLDTEVRADQNELPDHVNDLLVRCIINA